MTFWIFSEQRKYFVLFFNHTIYVKKIIHSTSKVFMHEIRQLHAKQQLHAQNFCITKLFQVCSRMCLVY